MNKITLDTYPDVLLIDDVRTILRIGKNKAYELVKKEIPHSLIGKVYYISKDDLIEYLRTK